MIRLFGLDVLELTRRVDEVVCVRLGHEPTLIWLLNEVFVSLLLRKPDGLVLCPEVDMGALHAIRRRLPANEGVLPSVSSLQNIPIHSPEVAVPGSRLCSRLRGTVDS